MRTAPPGGERAAGDAHGLDGCQGEHGLIAHKGVENDGVVRAGASLQEGAAVVADHAEVSPTRLGHGGCLVEKEPTTCGTDDRSVDFHHVHADARVLGRHELGKRKAPAADGEHAPGVRQDLKQSSKGAIVLKDGLHAVLVEIGG